MEKKRDIILQKRNTSIATLILYVSKKNAKRSIKLYV